MQVMNVKVMSVLAAGLTAVALLSGCLADASFEAGGPGSAVNVASSSVMRATVSRHTDGDTARFVLESGAEEKVRFIGIDTPEVYGEVEAFGHEASAYTADAIPVGTKVWLETDAELRDQYGRLLAYVWLKEPGTRDASDIRAGMLNAWLVRDGFAMVSTYPPNVRYVELFEELQREAREDGAGLWGE